VKREFRERAGLNPDTGKPEQDSLGDVSTNASAGDAPGLSDKNEAKKKEDPQESVEGKEVKPKQEQQFGWGHTAAARKQKAIREKIKKDEVSEIDALFGNLTMKNPPIPPRPMEQPDVKSKPSGLALSTAEERKLLVERQQAMAALQNEEDDRKAAMSDKRTMLEKQLDAEEEEGKRHALKQKLLGLQDLRRDRRGEPTRMQQAGGEVYCWWELPDGVDAKKIKLDVKFGGSWLTLEIEGILIFDRELLNQVKQDDVVWSVEDGELHLTLTKMERAKLWEELGKSPEMKWDEKGEVIPETLPEPLSISDRWKMFQQMVEDTDDGNGVPAYEELSRPAQKMVDVMRRYKHAQATGDKKALYEAEEEMEAYGKIVI